MYEGPEPPDFDFNLRIVVFLDPNLGYSASVYWGRDNTPFMRGAADKSLLVAYTGLLDASGRTLGELVRKKKIKSIYLQPGVEFIEFAGACVVMHPGRAAMGGHI